MRKHCGIYERRSCKRFQDSLVCHFDTAYKDPGVIGIRRAAEVAGAGAEADSRIG
jgi:hypothetical protein